MPCPTLPFQVEAARLKETQKRDKQARVDKAKVDDKERRLASAEKQRRRQGRTLASGARDGAAAAAGQQRKIERL